VEKQNYYGEAEPSTQEQVCI